MNNNKLVPEDLLKEALVDKEDLEVSLDLKAFKVAVVQNKEANPLVIYLKNLRNFLEVELVKPEAALEEEDKLKDMISQ
jgi:hypothetical protein